MKADAYILPTRGRGRVLTSVNLRLCTVQGSRQTLETARFSCGKTSDFTIEALSKAGGAFCMCIRVFVVRTGQSGIQLSGNLQSTISLRNSVTEIRQFGSNNAGAPVIVVQSGGTLIIVCRAKSNFSLSTAIGWLGVHWATDRNRTCVPP